jgi:hypothetical protein
MTKCGRILRNTNGGPGLFSVDGNRYTFKLDGMWKPDEAPSV